jgi:cytochrome P450
MAMPETGEPCHPVDAVVHTDPYPYYARLRREQPLYFDADLGSWVATSAAAVEAALGHPQLGVRPPDEPVPRALAGTPAGEVFGRLVRMNDGDFHARHKPEVRRAADRFTPQKVADASAQAALDLASRVDANALLTAMPTQAMARLLGVPRDLLDRTVSWVDAFVQGIGAQASAQAVTRASDAARELMAQGEAQGLDTVQSANRIALMQQSADATAGLLGNAVRHLRMVGEPGRDASPEAWLSFAAEVARWDAPVQNTRRFAAAALTLAGRSIAKGHGVLLVLASANRDEMLNRDPDAFDVARRDRRSMSFGSGAHACPAEVFAVGIAAAGLRALGTLGPLDRLFGRCTGFRPLPNARIPVFEP